MPSLFRYFFPPLGKWAKLDYSVTLSLFNSYKLTIKECWTYRGRLRGSSSGYFFPKFSDSEVSESEDVWSKNVWNWWGSNTADNSIASQYLASAAHDITHYITYGYHFNRYRYQLSEISWWIMLGRNKSLDEG